MKLGGLFIVKCYKLLKYFYMKLQSNLWKLKIFHVLDKFLLISPILIIFLLSKSLTMTEVFWLQSFFSLAVLFLEVPSGYFADRFGRKYSIILGVLFVFLGFLFYGFGETFWHFVAINVLLGIGASFISGADSALLYDTLIKLKREKEYLKIESSYFAITGYSEAIAAIIGGFLAAVYMQELFFVQAGILFLLVPLAFTLKEPKIHKEQIHEKAIGIYTIVKFVLNDHKEIKWLVFYAGFLGTSILATAWFAQPFWQHIGVPIAVFGVLWASLSVACGISAHLAPKFEKYVGRKNALIWLILFSFLGYIGLGVFQNSIWAIIFFFFFMFAYGVAIPVIKDYINRLTTSDVRATVLSVQSMMEKLIFAIVGPLIGWNLDAFSFREAFLISAFFFFGAGIICLFFLQKHKILVK